MLGEHHDIEHEFSNFQEKIAALRAADDQFDAMVAEHDDLDNQIREFEEQQLPISDQEIEKLKFKRAALKDRVYQALRAS